MTLHRLILYRESNMLIALRSQVIVAVPPSLLSIAYSSTACPIHLVPESTQDIMHRL